MPTCGNCKTENQTVEHIKGCYTNKYTTVIEKPVAEIVVPEFVKAAIAQDYKPMALSVDVPDSKYALIRNDEVVFYEVRTGKKGKWSGFLFLDRLVGAPGDWRRTPIKNKDAKNAILAEIGADPIAAAARYGTEFTVCGVCNSPLSDADSIARGIGPVCLTKF